MSRSLSIAILTLAIVLGLCLRLTRLDADPNRRLGTDYLTDEGFYAKNARSFIETGGWLPPGDNHNHVYLAPIQCGLELIAFRLGGASLTSARTLSALLGSFLILLVALTLRPIVGDGLAALAALWLAVDPALVHLGRVALVESTLALATAVVFIVFARDPLGKHRSWILGFWWLVAFLIKGSAIAILPGLAIAWLVHSVVVRQARTGLARLAVFTVLVTLTAFAWRQLVRILPMGADVWDHASSVHLGSLTPSSVLSAWTDALASKNAFIGLFQSPVVFLLAVVATLWLGWSTPRLSHSSRAIAAAALGWGLGQALFFSALPYQPYRYFLSLSVPAIILATVAIAEFDRRRRIPSLAMLAVALLGAAPALFTTLKPIVHPTWADRDARRAVQAHLAPGDVVLGFFADSFTLGTPAHAVVVHGPWNSKNDPRTTFGATKALMLRYEANWLLTRFPALAASAQKVTSVETARGVLDLYTLSATGDAPVPP